MAQAVTETWNWPKISKRTQQAAIAAVDAATSGAANTARPQVNVLTGRLKASVGNVPAQTDSKGDVVGYVGYLDNLPYSLVQEIENPAIRPAADTNARQIPAVMKQRVQGGG